MKIYRGSAPITTPEQREQLQAASDRARAQALNPPAPPEMTREHAIEIAWKNGALKVEAARLQYRAERDGQPLTDERALELAKDVIDTFGDTTGTRRQPLYPYSYAPSGLAGRFVKIRDGRYAKGRRVRTFTGTSVAPPIVASRNQRHEAALRLETKARAAQRATARRAKHARTELEAAGAGNSDRQREAHVLVRVQGLSMAEAGRRMTPPIHRQTVADLLRKFDAAQKETTGPQAGPGVLLPPSVGLQHSSTTTCSD